MTRIIRFSWSKTTPSSSSILWLRRSLGYTNGCFSHNLSPLGSVLSWVQEVINRPLCPGFDVIQPHLPRPSLSSLLFQWSLQYLCTVGQLLSMHTTVDYHNHINNKFDDYIHHLIEQGHHIWWSAVECRIRNQGSPGSNPPLLPFRSLGIFVISMMHLFTQLYKWVPGCRQWWKIEWFSRWV